MFRLHLSRRYPYRKGRVGSVFSLRDSSDVSLSRHPPDRESYTVSSRASACLSNLFDLFRGSKKHQANWIALICLPFNQVQRGLISELRNCTLSLQMFNSSSCACIPSETVHHLTITGSGLDTRSNVYIGLFYAVKSSPHLTVFFWQFSFPVSLHHHQLF